MSIEEDFEVEADKARKRERLRVVEDGEKAPARKKRVPQAAMEREPGFPFNNDEFAALIIDRYGAFMRWVPERDSWHVWSAKQHRWAEDVGGVAVRTFALRVGRAVKKRAGGIDDPTKKGFYLKLADACLTAGFISGALNLAKSYPNIRTSAALFDADPSVIACGSTLVNLRDPDRTREISPADLITMNTGVQYSEGAVHSGWSDFLETFLPDVVIREWVQSLAGYSLLGGNPERLFIMCIGETTTGKTYFANSVERALGNYSDAFGLQMLRAKQDSDINVQLASAMNQRYMFAEETSEGWILHGDEIKRLTGETKVSARRPFDKRPISGVLQATPWLVANGSPTIYGTDAALKRRLRYVEFGVSLKADQEKVERRALLRDESFLRAVLAWAVEGAARYAKDGHRAVETPEEARRFTEEQLGELNLMERFLSDVCERAEGFRESPVKLYEAFQTWCYADGMREGDIPTNTKFGNYLNSNGYKRKRIRVEGVPEWFRIGVRIRGRS